MTLTFPFRFGKRSGDADLLKWNNRHVCACVCARGHSAVIRTFIPSFMSHGHVHCDALNAFRLQIKSLKVLRCFKCLISVGFAGVHGLCCSYKVKLER